MTEFDFSELNALAADLGSVAGRAGPLINKAVQVTAGKVKAEARASVAAGASSWKRLPNMIDYDVKGLATVLGSLIQVDIGYRLGGAGSLGGIREFGSAHAVPHNDLANALHANEGDFEKGLLLATAQAEREAGL